MNFSERSGIVTPKNVLQIGEMDYDLKSSIWNVLFEHYFGLDTFLYSGDFGSSPLVDGFSKRLWSDFFKKPIDQRPSNRHEILKSIRNYYFTRNWWQVYDFVEFCIAFIQWDIITPMNKILERELSGYRIIDGNVIPITSKEEIDSVNEAITCDVFPGASTHLKTSIDLISNKSNPDYRNSIKESISAVESACCKILGNSSASLGAALKKISETHPIHSALNRGFMNLYGYTSDGDGIRHSMMDEPNLTQSDAIYFLVSCSSFINYLKAKID